VRQHYLDQAAPSSSSADPPELVYTGAEECMVSGCLLKTGDVVECAYGNEQGGEIEWICGKGKTGRAFVWHASSHVAFSALLLACCDDQLLET